MTSHVYINTDSKENNLLTERESAIQGKKRKGHLFNMYDSLTCIISFLLGDKCKITLQRSQHHKCPRCWNYHSIEQDQLCTRCAHTLE